MRHRKIFGLYLVSSAVLCALALWVAAPRVEDQLSARAAAALAASTIQLNGVVVFDGRDAWLSGEVESSQALIRAEQVLSELAGVRRVHNRLRVVEPSARAEDQR